MKYYLVCLFAAAATALPALASNYAIQSSKAVNAEKTLQLGVHLYPSLSAWCSDDAVFAQVTNPNVPQAQREAADKRHQATIPALPELRRKAKVYAEKVVRVLCSGDPDAGPMAFVRVPDGKYAGATGWISAEALP